MDRSRSSGGVGWSNGYWGIVISKRTPRLARLEVRRKSLNMISRPCVFFCISAPRECSPIEILLVMGWTSGGSNKFRKPSYFFLSVDQMAGTSMYQSVLLQSVIQFPAYGRIWGEVPANWFTNNPRNVRPTAPDLFN